MTATLTTPVTTPAETAADVWARISETADMIDSLMATRNEWAMFDAPMGDVNGAIALELVKLGNLQAIYNAMV